MTNPRTLKELTDLKNSRFGRPYPRHGLKLLYWFANEFMFFNNNNKMCCQYDPKNTFYGFHRFKNRNDKNGVKLLPDAQISYYVVGNLNSQGADDLPDYVREDYSGSKDGSNMDRIIVSVDDQSIESVYVTEHSDRTDFNKEATFFISKELLMIIREMTFEEFLSKSGYTRPGMDYGQKTGVPKPHVNFSQRAWLSGPQEEQAKRAWLSSPAEDDEGQKNWFSSPQKEEQNQINWFSSPQENISQESPQVSTIQSSVEDDTTNFFDDDNETTKCCRCVIL